MNVLQAMSDPEMFGPFFPPRTRYTPATFEGDTWAAWKALLAAMFALPMDDAALALFRQHTGRQTPPAEPSKKVVLVTGRRGGKSRVLATIATYLATVPDYTGMLAPGETPTVAVIASDRRQARSIFRYIRGLLANVPALSPLLDSETAEAVTLTNGVAIEVQTASFRSTRGYTLVAALCDEVAFWRAEDSANPDQEVINALEPALGTLDGPLLIASSPYAKRGVLYREYRQGWGKDDADTLVWQGSTEQMNPDFPARLIAKAYADDATRAAAEYGARFRDDVAGYVTREIIEGCTIPGRFELPPITGTRYVAFVDPSGGSSDSMTLAIAHRDKPHANPPSPAVLDVIREAKPPFSPEQVVQDFCALLKEYCITKVKGDRYAGEWAREPFRKLGITYELSEKPKSDIYRDLLPKLNSGQVELLDLSRLSKQFCDLERRTARGGRDSIDHAPNSKDDVVNAAAGALLDVTTGRAPMVIASDWRDAGTRRVTHHPSFYKI